MNTVRLGRTSLPLLPLCLLSLLLGCPRPGAAQTAGATPPPGQGGTIQMPMRVCDLHDFDPAKHEPYSPGAIGAMTQGPPGDDSFYSTSEFGGTYNRGTIFKVTVTKVPVAGVVNNVTVTQDVANVDVLYSFGLQNGPEDGLNPKSGLALGHDGYLYGTTTYGGTFGAGTIFRLKPGDKKPEYLYSFHNGRPDPPGSTLPQANPATLTQQQKDDLAASTPWSAPLLGLDGNLYGAATTGEGHSTGVLYQFNPNSHTFRCVHRFRSEEQADFGLFPVGLSRGWDGNFYGTTLAGGLGAGTVYQFNPSNAAVTGGNIRKIYRFNNVAPNDDGADSWGVIQGFDRNLYGTLYAGGPNGRGVLFRLTVDGAFTKLHNFGGTDSRPGPGVVEVLQIDPLEKGQRTYFLYGAASWNYSISTRFNSGILYRIREQPYPEVVNQGKEFSVIYNVEGANGSTPSTTPMLARDSNLYGTMAGGGAHQQGVFYRLNTKYEASGDSGTFRLPSDPPGLTHQNVVFMGDPGGKSVIIDDRSPIQVIIHVAGFQPANSDLSKWKTSDGITVRVKDVPPFLFWPRPNAWGDRAQFVQFFFRQRIDSTHKAIQGLVEEWSHFHTYFYQQTARYNNFLWFSKKDGNLNHPPPPNQDCATSVAGCTDPNWEPGYRYTDPNPPHAKHLGPCGPSEMKLYNCTLEPPCPQIDYLEVQSPKDPGGSGNVYAAGYECIPLTINASQPKWIVDAEGRMANPSMGGRIDPYYNPFDIQADCDGVTLFDSPTLMRNGPLPRPANTATPNPDEDQIFTALDYVIIDRNVVARVKWTLEEKPYDDEEYSGPYLIPAPTPAEAACFADLLDHYNFYVPFNVPGNVKCPFPYYGP